MAGSTNFCNAYNLPYDARADLLGEEWAAYDAHYWAVLHPLALDVASRWPLSWIASHCHVAQDSAAGRTHERFSRIPLLPGWVTDTWTQSEGGDRTLSATAQTWLATGEHFFCRTKRGKTVSVTHSQPISHARARAHGSSPSSRVLHLPIMAALLQLGCHLLGRLARCVQRRGQARGLFGGTPQVRHQESVRRGGENE